LPIKLKECEDGNNRFFILGKISISERGPIHQKEQRAMGGDES